MSSSIVQEQVARLLETADIHLDGERPWDVQVHDQGFYLRVLLYGSLGLGESYMEGWWDCDCIDELITHALRSGIDSRVGALGDFPVWLRDRLTNPQRPSRARQIGERHYDIGDDLYRRMLDRRMIYSCGYWPRSEDLDAAQEAKLELCCLKLRLQPGMRLLDIGCGWGGLLQYAAERYGVTGVGVTVSRRQLDEARRRCAGLPIEIRLQDYRELEGTFDRIVSIGMFEHVGLKNHRRFMTVARRCLESEGLFLLQTIGNRSSNRHNDAWIEHYIFPNSLIPSVHHIARASDGLFVQEDWHSFGVDYDRTLMAWHTNFEAAWADLRETYGERFYRMWRFYLLSCAGAFRARVNQLWQIVFSPEGVMGGYESIR